MKRISIIVMSLSAALFAAGCGQSHDNRQADGDRRKLSHETVADMNGAAQDAEHAVRDTAHAANAATAGAAYEVRQASLQMRDDVRQPSAAIPVANTAQLGREVKRDAVNAAGAAAEQEAARLLNFK
jgi:hypothetical protein